MSAKPLWSCVLALALGGLAAGQAPSATPTPTPSPSEAASSFVSKVSIGFANGTLAEAPSPVWITLHNRDAEEQALTLVVSGGDTRVKREVTIPAGGRRRVFVAVLIRWNELTVQLRRGQEIVESRDWSGLSTLDVQRHLVVIDGRPAEAGHTPTRRDNPTLHVSAIRPEQAPAEASCYAPLGGVLLRGVDPGALTRDQLDALLEYTLGGGSLILSSSGKDRAKLLELLEEVPGGKGHDETVKLLGRPTLVRAYGRGRLIAFPNDVLAEIMGPPSTRADRLRTGLGDLVAERARAVSIAPTHETFGSPFGGHPGAFSASLVAIFIGLYLLIVGPGLAIGLRKSSRRKLAIFTLCSVIAFSFLALIVAGMVRNSSGTVFVREAVFVPPRGVPVAAADLTIVSGGAWSQTLDLEAERSLPFAAILAEGGGQGQFNDRWQPAQFQVRASETQRGNKARFDLELSPWDQRSVHVLQARSDLRPLEAEVTPTKGNTKRGRAVFELRVKNTSDAAIGPAIVLENGPVNATSGYWELGVLRPGEERRLEVWRGNRNLDALKSDYTGPWWSTSLGVPKSWVGWTRLAATSRGKGQRALRLGFFIVSKIEGKLSASSTNLDVRHHALRVDLAPVTGQLERGFAGLSVGPGTKIELPGNKVLIETRITHVVPRGPAGRAGLRVGDVLVSINGPGRQNRNLLKPADLLDELSYFQPGQRVRVTVRSNARGQRPVTLKLVRELELKQP